MKMITTLIVVFAFASSVLGECPVPPTVPGADIGKIAGRWYEIAGPTFDELPCVTYDFTPREDGNFNFTILANNPDGSMYRENLLAERTDDQNLLNVYSMAYKTSFPITLYTDYDNYMARHTCFIVPPRLTLQSGVILSRINSISADKYAELMNLLLEVGVPCDEIGPIPQKDCKYWPIPQ